MSVEFRYSTRQESPGLKDLDNVVLLAPAVTDDGDTILTGTLGTIVSAVEGGADCIVEFPEPMGALAVVPRASVVCAEPTGSKRS